MRKFIVPYLMLFATIGSLAACSTEPYKKVVWANPNVASDMQRRQLNTDVDACWKLATDAIPEPSLRSMGFRMKDRLGWQIINQRDDTQMRYVASCLAVKGWRAEERVIG
jgi:hypothetical protein